MYYMGKYQNSIIYMDLALRSLSAFINFYLHVNPSTLETYLDPFLKNLLKNFNLEIDVYPFNPKYSESGISPPLISRNFILQLSK